MNLASNGTELWNPYIGAKFTLADHVEANKLIAARYYLGLFNQSSQMEVRALAIKSKLIVHASILKMMDTE